MSIITVAILAGVIWLVVGTAISIRWMRGFTKQIGENRKAGLYKDPELLRQIRRMYIVLISIIAFQLVLVGLAVFTRPSSMGWIAIAVLFVVSFMARLWTNAIRRRLWTQGLK